MGSQDTFYVGNIKGVLRIYQQTLVDSYSRVAHVKLSDRKNALVAAEVLNDRVLPWFEDQEVKLLRILTDRGSEFVGNVQHHEYDTNTNCIWPSRTLTTPRPKLQAR